MTLESVETSSKSFIIIINFIVIYIVCINLPFYIYGVIKLIFRGVRLVDYFPLPL